MKQKTQNKTPRPYWHVDLKWIFGILSLFALGASLLLFNLVAITERDRATTLSATIVASLFSKDGLDDEKGVDEFRQKAAAMPGDVVTPIEQFPWLHISKHDATNLSPRDLRIAIFRQMTEPIYDKGLSGAAAQITKDPAEQEKFTKQASLLGVFTKSTHESLERAFLWASLATVILFFAVIYFSAGWGRLVSPGVLLLAVSPLGAIAGLLLLHPPADGDSPFASIPPSIGDEIGNTLNGSYLPAVFIGLALLTVALIGKVTQKVRSRHKIAASK